MADVEPPPDHSVAPSSAAGSIDRTVSAIIAADFETLRLDYSETLATWRSLVDVRFRLLTLVPTITGIGVALLARRPGYESALVAGLALTVLFGIVIYDLRNSTFHDAAVHRAKELEVLLGAPRLSDKGGAGGLANERPREKYTLFGVLVWHDRGLFVIYAASAAGWAALLCLGIAGGLNLAATVAYVAATVAYVAAAATAVAAFFVVLKALHLFDNRVVQPRSPRTSNHA